MKFRSLLGVVLPLFLLASALQAGREYPAQPGEQVMPQQFLVRMRPGILPMSVIPSFIPGVSVTAMNIPDVYLIKVPPGTLGTAISRLAAHLLVDFVEPNRIRHATVAPPNDPGVPQQWALQALQAQQAWNLFPNQYLTAATAGTNRVNVAIIDTGIDCTHPDFINSGGSSTDSAAGGQLNFSLSQAALDTPTTISPAACPWQDDYGHGTHVAGIVAAATQNATGIASLGYPLQLIAYKVLDSTGSGTDADVSNAISLAADKGAQVISLSLTGAGYSQTMQAAVTHAWQKNALVVAAAGNASSSATYYPADATYAVGVSATDSNGNFASFSNFGNGIAIAAPGVTIYSLLPTYTVPLNGPNYGYLSGTSMATPMVSALAGLLAMENPGTSNAAILQRIQQSASSSTANGGWDQEFGYGIINAYSALSGTLRSATLGSLVGQITDNNANPVTGAQIVVNSQTVTVDSSGLYRFPNLPAGSYTVSVTAAGFTAVNLTATIAPGADTTLPVVMGMQYGLFTGTVTDSGVAVPGAIVQAVSNSLIAATAVAGSNGQYSLWIPGGGTFNLVISGMSRNTTTLANQTVAAGGTTNVNLTNSGLGVISGTVTDTSLNPLANVQITITGTNISATTQTAANGSYSTVPLPLGNYTLTFSSVAYQNVVSNVASTGDGVTTLNVEMPALVVPWYSTGGSWSGRKPVTINHGQVSGASSLASFPVLISVTDPNLKTVGNGGGVAQSNGNDIVFTSGDGLTKLNHEIEVYNGTTGQLTAWVQVPSLSPAADTLIYLYYGNGGAGNQQNAAGTWDSNYKIVNHLNQASGPVLDSTGNGNNATASATGATYVAAGEMGGAYKFDGVNGLLTTPYSSSWSGSFSNYTVQMWVKFGAGVQNYEGALTVGGWGGPMNIWAYPGAGENVYTLNTSGGGCSSSTATPVTTDTVNFHQVAMTYDGGAGKFMMYVDGVAAPQVPCTGTTSMGTAALELGGFANFKLLPSTIDELRVSTATRAPAWIATEYNNQSAPGNFATLGAQQENPGGPPPAQVVAPAFNPLAGTYTGTQMVGISTTTAGAAIRYTTDGVTVPSETVGTVYGGTAIPVASTTTVMAIAYKAGMTDSPVSTAVYTINAGGGPAWYSTGGTWSGRKPVTINHGQVSGASSLASFPVLISVTDPNLKTVGNGGGVAQSNGNDIVFTSGDGLTKLNHEIEVYNGTTGQLTAWVQVPSLSPAADTLIYLYYGNGGAGNQQNAAGTWDSNYKIVNHLNQASGPVLDSTGNGNNATASATGATYVAAGEMGGAYKFDGVNGLLTTPYSSSWSGSFSNYTVQMWVKFGAGVQNYEGALTVGGWGGPMNIWAYPGAGENVYTLNTSGGGCSSSTAAPVTTDTVNFHQVAMTYDGGAGKFMMYVDGVAAPQVPCTGTTSMGTAALELGGFANFKLLPSTIDELRVSTATRAPAWIATEYNNQSAPGSFATLGAQQENPGGPPPAQVVAPAFNPLAGTYTGTQMVGISTTTAGAAIRYTTDGVTVPSETVGTVYGGTAIPVASTTTVMAIAYKAGMTDSPVSTAVYTINAGGGPAWYSTGGTWSGRKPVTINHGQVSGASSLASFPVLISVTDPNLKTVGNGGGVAQSNGNDIVFTSGDGLTKLNHEIEVYNGTTGQLTAWVQVPSLSPAADTLIYLYYGNGGAGNQQNAAGTWDSNYKIVNHLNQVSGPVLDSTGNGNNATASATGATYVAAGEMGGAYKFDGVNGLLTTPYSSSWSGSFSNYTVQMWVKFGAGVQNYEGALTVGGWGGPMNIWAYPGAGENVYTLNTSGGGCSSSTATPVTTDTVNFHQVAMTYDGGAGKFMMYVDGVAAPQVPCTGTTSMGTAALELGGFANFKLLPSTIDELRVSTATRAPAWIATEYNNQSAPGSFATLGAQQENPGGPPPAQVVAPAFNPLAGTYTGTQMVGISTTTAGAAIRYTTDGVTVPSETVGTVYGGTAIPVASTTTVMAIAYKAGMTDSPVSTAVYTINAGGGPAWYSTGGTWSGRKPVTINHGQVSGASSLASFPVLISVTDPNLKTVGNGGGVAQSNGNDIVFTSGDGLTKLNHEIEVYNGTTGQLTAWVQVPSLSPAADTLIYLYYGNGGAGNQQNAAGTWDSNYKIVNHLNQASGPVLDSTGNGNNATASATGATYVAAGEMGGAYKFDGVNGLLTTPYSSSWSGSFSNYTVQMWVKFGAGVQNYEGALTVGGWGGPMNIWAYPGAGENVYTLNTSGGGCSSSTAAPVTTDTVNFHQVAMTYDGGAGKFMMYVDGVAAPQVPCTGTTSMGTAALELGGFANFKLLPSTIDELRVSTATRAPAWIATEYNNQSAPGSFVTLGAQQQNPGG